MRHVQCVDHADDLLASPLYHLTHPHRLTTSVCVQANKDFVPILKRMSNEERLTLLHLVSDDGMILDRLHDPLALLLEPFLTSSRDAVGNSVVRLSAPWHAPLIQVSF